MSALRFTIKEVDAASDAWGFNCGPGALCAVAHLTPDELRPHLGDFESKRYTNPSLMVATLARLGLNHRRVFRSDEPTERIIWPAFGLVRIQWGGPWTRPGVPMRARYRETHWIAVRHAVTGDMEVYDVNAMCVGGWIDYPQWSEKLVPWLIKECVPKGNGFWWPTHGLEITP